MSDFLDLFDAGGQRDFIERVFKETVTQSRDIGIFDATKIVTVVLLKTKSSGDFIGYNNIRLNFIQACEYAEDLKNE